MNEAMAEVASTSCKDGKFGLGSGFNKNWVLIAIVLVLICGCSGKGPFAGVYNQCCKSRNVHGGTLAGFGGGSWIWILLALAFLSPEGVLGNNAPGNVNTNVINVDANDDCDDECYD